LVGVIAFYILLAMVVAFFGRRRKFGAWGYFFAALLLTPMIGLLLVLASDPRPRVVNRPDLIAIRGPRSPRS
jgi:hypothetical protein